MCLPAVRHEQKSPFAPLYKRGGKEELGTGFTLNNLKVAWGHLRRA